MMRAIKIIVAVFTTILGVSTILGGLATIGLGIVFMLGMSILGNVAETVTDAFNQLGALFLGIVGFLLIIIGIVFLIPGIIWLILGIKFFSKKPNKGIAITLAVFYFLGTGGMGITLTEGFVFEWFGGALFCAVMAALLILYLVMLGKHEHHGGQQHVQQPAQPQPQQQPQQVNFDPNTGQRLN